VAERRTPVGGLLRAAAAGAGAAALAWAVGVDLGHVAALGTVAAAVTAVVVLVPLGVPPFWPEDEPPTSGTGWHQVALLAGVLGQTDRDADRVESTRRRVRALAESRLARAGVPWTDPRARDLLGTELFDVLDGLRPPPRATRLVAAVLDRLDALEVAGSHDHR
jgi:hypothetical protein